MRKLIFVLFISFVYHSLAAQSFEGVLKIDYTNEKGHRSAADVYAKGDKFFIRRMYGGCDRYDAYIFDAQLHTLFCLSSQNPQTALRLNIDQIMDIYEKKQLKQGYKIHSTLQYSATGASRKIENMKATQKKLTVENTIYEIWITDLHINSSALIPVLRVTGFWDMSEDEDNVILESDITNKKSKSVSTLTLIPERGKVDDILFTVPSEYQQVDMDKFLINEARSPRFADLVKAFAGF